MNPLIEAVLKPVVNIVIQIVAVPEKPLNDTLEILSKVNEFYDSSWDKLLYVLSGAFGVLAFIVPAVIHHYQKKSIKLSEEKLENTIHEKIKQAKQDIQDTMFKELEIKTAEFEKKIEISTKKSQAQTFHLQGNNYIDKDNYTDALIDHIRASEMHLEVDDKLNLKTTLEAILFCLTKLKKEDLELLKNANSINLNEVLKKIEEVKDTKVFFREIQGIRKELHKINSEAL